MRAFVYALRHPLGYVIRVCLICSAFCLLIGLTLGNVHEDTGESLLALSIFSALGGLVVAWAEFERLRDICRF